LYFSSDRGGSMNVWRVDLHPQTHAPREAPTPVTSSVRALGYTRAVAQDNRIVVMAYDRVADLELYRVTPTGVERTATLRPRSAHWCAPSPDATWIACSTSGAAEDVILLKADGSELRRLTNDAIKDRVPIWAPDGQSLAFPSTRSGEWGLWSVGIDGSELRQLSAMRDGQDQVFSADGKELLVASFTDVWRVPTAPGGRLDSAQKVATPVPGLHPLAWDRDGKRVAAYEATPAGTITGIGIWDLTANQFTRFPANVANIDPNGVVGGWLPDGRHVVFRTADGVMLIDATAPRNQRVILSCGPRDRVTVSRDGRTLLVEREVFDSDIWMLERQP
jgi:dipeptidyl aminopeptidase/acylaminoacyl peptidase